MAAGELLSLLARVNLAGAAAIVLVVVLRKVARPRFGARLVYSLWLLPVLAAAAVLSPARAVTVAAQTAPRGEVFMPFFEGAAPVSSPAAVAATLDPKMMILALWLVGVVAAAAVMTLLQRRFTAEVRKGAIGPAVVGVIAPRIVMPRDFEQKFSREEQVLVLAHERAHIERQDSRLNGLSAAIQCLCWFNPLVHLASHLMRIDQEMACDETVVTRFPEARRAYAQALVKAQLAIRPLPLGCYWPSGTEHPLLERIAMLKRNNLSRRRRLAGGSALAVLCAATGFAAWASQPPQVRIVSAPASADASVADATPAAAMHAPTPTAAAAATSQVAEAPAAGSAEAAKPNPLAVAEVALSPEAAPTRVAALDPPPGGDQPPPPGPRGGQLVPAGPAPGGPPPGEAPPAWLERPWEPNSVINPTVMKTVEGVVNAVKWTYPSSEIWVRETTSGQVVMVNTSAAGPLTAAGIDRQTLGPGAAVTIKGYPARNGSRLFADPAEIVAGGKPLASAPTAGLPQLLSRRLAICGDLPTRTIFPTGVLAQDRKVLHDVVAAWQADCDAKVAKAGE
jgi:beta-lactamase regulating signal transducer with metallopeptidase domain